MLTILRSVVSPQKVFFARRLWNVLSLHEREDKVNVRGWVQLPGLADGPVQKLGFIGHSPGRKTVLLEKLLFFAELLQPFPN